jgi:mannose-6-phosphate isomerase-like protein (cupin superfamily)/ribosomal protein L40E
MDRIEVDAADAETLGGLERRRLGDALAADHVAINHYRVAPDERLAGLHAHAHQAEVFVVLDGAATFETLTGRVEVADGEGVRFPPGEFQSCHNTSEEEAVVLALGAPPDSEDVRVPVACPDCGADEHRLTFTDGEEGLVCPECGAETAPACPDCGSGDLRVVLDDEDQPVERCRDCGATRPAR